MARGPVRWGRRLRRCSTRLPGGRHPTQGPTRHRWTELRHGGPGNVRLECPCGSGNASGGGKHGGRGAAMSGEVRWGVDEAARRRRRWASGRWSSSGRGRCGRSAMMVSGGQANARWRRQKCKVVASKCEGRKETTPFPNHVHIHRLTDEYSRAHTYQPCAPYISW
jgi:hypothetical protein